MYPLVIIRDLSNFHTFSALWLRSSVVSVLISVKTDFRVIYLDFFHIHFSNILDLSLACLCISGAGFQGLAPFPL